jgi:hypothetical protein
MSKVMIFGPSLNLANKYRITPIYFGYRFLVFNVKYDYLEHYTYLLCKIIIVVF